MLQTTLGKFLSTSLLVVAAVPAAYLLTSLVLAPAFRPEIIIAVFQETILKDIGMFMYLALFLGVGIYLILHFRGVEKFY